MPTKLGQNFLIDHQIIEKIINSADITSDDLVLEIGPGKGVLTEALLRKAGKVLTIEIDEGLVKNLQEKFKNTKNLEIINENILDTDLNTLYQIPNTSYKVIANIPYYITAKILRKFLESNFPPQEMILMVQKEVAERIVASPGKMSLLSLSVQYYAEPEILFEVNKKCFSPVPEVNSAVIRIKPKSSVRDINETQKIFRLARIGFASKRKTLLNNLSSSLQQEKGTALKKLESLGFSQNTRAQELSVENWQKLARMF